jgi:hypothetical protein
METTRSASAFLIQEIRNRPVASEKVAPLINLTGNPMVFVCLLVSWMVD